MSNVEKVKDAVRIEGYLSSRFPSLKRSSNLYKMCCPMHADKTPSFIVNAENQSWRCYGACQKGGDVIAFVMEHDRLDFGEALRTLADYAHITLEPLTPQNKEKADKRERLYMLMEDSTKLFEEWLWGPVGEHALRYLRETRGLSDATIKAARMGLSDVQGGNALCSGNLIHMGYTDEEQIAAGMAKRSDEGRMYDTFRNRIMFPLFDHKGRAVGFSGRDMGEKGPKYKNTGETELFHKSQILYGISSDKADLRGLYDQKVKVCVEGHMCVISAYNRGFKNVYAQMGTSLSETQLNLLCKGGVETLILCLDKDKAGDESARRSILAHAHTCADKGVTLKVMHAPYGKDPDDTFREHPELWQPAVDAARPAIDALIEQEVSRLPKEATSIDKQRAAQSLIPLLKGSNALLQEDSLKALAKALDYPLEVMKSWTDKQASIVVMPKNPAPKPVTQGPTDEHWLLFYILRFEADEYINRADQILCAAGLGLPPAAWHMHAFMGVSVHDFTDTKCQRLMGLIKQARERNEPLVDTLGIDTHETDLQETFERCMGAHDAAILIGQCPEISMRSFLDTVLTVRMARVDVIMSACKADVEAWSNYQSAWVALDEKRNEL